MRDQKLQDIARAGSTSKVKGMKNISRNFHNKLKRDGRVLPVKVSMVKLRVQVHRPRVREVEADYPFIRLQDWASYLLKNHSRYLLGGYDISEKDEFMSLFARFWERYQPLDKEHPVYSNYSLKDRRLIVPYFVHGDEGRGKSKCPVLITSYQPVIAVGGEDYTNMKGYFGVD